MCNNSKEKYLSISNQMTVRAKNITKIDCSVTFVFICCILTTLAQQHNEVLLPPKSHVKMDTGNEAIAACQHGDYEDTFGAFEEERADACRKELSVWLEDINKQVLKYNVLTADFAWEVSVNPSNPKLTGRGASIDKERTKWRTRTCNKMAEVDLFFANDSQRRQFYLLCRGATQSSQESEMLSSILGEMQTIYTSSKICIPKLNSTFQNNNPTDSHENYIINYLENVERDFKNRKNNAAEINSILSKASFKDNEEITNKFDFNAFFNTIIDNNNENTAILYNEESNEIDSNIHYNKSNFDTFSTLEKSTEHRRYDDLRISDEALKLAAKMTAEHGISETNMDFICLSGEPDLERIMARSRQEPILKWTWLVWREKVGPPMKEAFAEMVELKNAAAKRSGYSDLGEVWREELETPDLQNLVENLYLEVKSLYTALHGVVRYFLREHYGPDVVKETGAIPGHLLGNMWAQNWEKVIDFIIPQSKKVDLDDIIKKTNWTTQDMLKRSEDFYTSIGLFPMTDRFWQYSYFGEETNASKNTTSDESDITSNIGNNDITRVTKCHGTAANMYMPGDFRMIYCAGLTMEDFYVIHHEMGHIEYYMSYDKNLPTIFQDGTNSAFQESVGDSIMYAVLTPQHLQRLGLIQDKLVYVYPKQKFQNKQISNNIRKRHDNHLPNSQQTPVHDNQQLDYFWGIHKNFGQQPYIQKSNDVNLENGFIESSLEKLVSKMQDHLDSAKKILNNNANDSPYEKLLPVDVKMLKKHDNIVHSGNLHYNKMPERFSNTFDSMKGKNIVDYKVNDKSDDLDKTNNIADIDFDTVLLLRQALSKIPQIPFGFLIDKYRWDIFSGKIDLENYNNEFWRMVREIQGIEPPDGEIRGEEYFDAGAKFHIPDNTPYVRYFLSSFLQVQMFRGMCRLSLFGETAPHHELPMPLHRCDIYGSKKAGKKLREMMSKGSSIHWSEALNILTGESTISSSALLQYFQPLQSILNKIITKHNIPVGW